MPHAQYARIDPKKRAKLIKAATRAFAAHGFEQASLNEILAASGIGKSSYYYFFADKEDLFATVIETAWRALEARLPALALDVPAAADFWREVERYQLAFVDALQREPQAFELFRALQPLRRAPSPRLRTTFALIAANLQAIIRVGRTRGLVRTDIDEALLLALVDAADAALDSRLDAASPSELKAHMRLAHDTLRRLLAPAAA